MTDAPTGRYSGNEYIHNLHMGDFFRSPGDPHLVYGPVASVDSSYDLTWTNVNFGGNTPKVERHAFTRVEITKRGPRCECGRAYENCEMDCPWPDEIEALWASSF